jgi:hypothetical protein
MNQDITPAAQQISKRITSDCPSLLEFLVRCRYIHNRKVKPQHISASHFLPKLFDPKEE